MTIPLVPVPSPLLQRALAALAPAQPLAACRAVISLRADDALAPLVGVPAALGCSEVELVTSNESSRIVVRTAAGERVLNVELRRAADAFFSTADVPMLAYTVERWQLDHAVWDELLPRAARGSLPGRVLTVRGYGRRGRSIAWRARALGMDVQIEAAAPHDMLDALYDGFEAAGTRAPGTLVDTLDEVRGPFAVPAAVPPGLTDEVCALAALALAALAGAATPNARERIATACEASFADLLLAVRSAE